MSARCAPLFAQPHDLPSLAVSTRATDSSQVVSPRIQSEALESLALIEDDSFNLGQPGVYKSLAAILEFGIASGDAENALALTDWSALLERRDDYRGRLVRVTGVVGRNSSWRLHTPPLDALGVISEIQIRAAEQPITCKLLMVSETADIPVGSTVTFVGYFAMIQRYYGPSGREQRAAVLVGVGPTEIVRSTAAQIPATSQGAGPWGWTIVLAGGLLVAWIALRAVTRAPPPDRGELTARQKPTVNLSDEFDAWSRSQSAEDKPNHD